MMHIPSILGDGVNVYYWLFSLVFTYEFIDFILNIKLPIHHC